ncbi:MAG: ATP-binding protein [Gemmatimonadaceae bacterium]
MTDLPTPASAATAGASFFDVTAGVTAELREAEVRLMAEVMPQLVWTATPEGEHDYFNARWYEYTGMSRAVAGAPEWRWTGFLHPDDRERAERAWRHSLETGEPFEVEHRIRRAADGTHRWFVGRAVALRDAAGRVVRWFGTFTDIDDAKHAEGRARVLAEAAAALVRTLDADAELGAVARVAVPRLADWCAVDLLDPAGGALRRVAVHHADPAKVALARRLAERWPEPPDAGPGAWRAVRTGATELLPEIPAELLERASADREQLAILRELGLRSAIVVPIRQVGERGGDDVRVLGALTLVSAEAGRRFGPGDVETAEEMARHIGAAIERTRLYADAVTARKQIAADAERLAQQAAELEVQNEQLQEQAAELEAQAAQLAEQAAEAEAARARAEEANAAKGHFLATMSHELRTPLNAVNGYADLLALGVRGPVNEAQRDDLERIKRSGQHLLTVINDILHFAKLEAGQIEFDVGDVHLEGALAEVEALIAPQLAAKGLVYSFGGCGAEGARPAVVAHADRERCQQIVLNLLTNAVKFTPPGGRVTVSCGVEGERVFVRVSDTGIGIPPDKLATVFHPFVQVSRKLNRPSEGVGLGLAISRDLARGMRGDLTVESTPGQGSTFTLTLPRAKA